MRRTSTDTRFAPRVAPATLPLEDAALLYRVIVTRHPAGHWNAVFENAPQQGFTGVNMAHALSRLFNGCPERQIDGSTGRPVNGERSATRAILTFEGSDFIEHRDELRAAFLRFGG